MNSLNERQVEKDASRIMFDEIVHIVSTSYDLFILIDIFWSFRLIISPIYGLSTDSDQSLIWYKQAKKYGLNFRIIHK